MRLGVRARSTLLVAGVVGVALVLGGIVMVKLLERNLEDNLDQTLTQQAADRAQLLETGAIDPSLLSDSRFRESFVWIGTADGAEVASGGAVRTVESPPIHTDGPRTVELLIQEAREPEEGPESYSFRIVAAATPEGDRVVVVGAQIEEVGDAVGEVARILLVGIPAVVVLVAALAWFVSGRALRPVEGIRRRAERITGSNVDERVPVPPGRDEIHDLALTVNGMLDRIDQHQQSIRRFTSDASHELKSPVANIRSLVETAPVDGPEWDRLQPRLVAETGRLGDLVDNMLYLASHEDDSAPPRVLAVIDVDELLFEEAETIAATSDIHVDISGVEPLKAVGDRQDLRRLLRNLADNAARHADSVVAFSATSEGSMVVLRVVDDGPGVPTDMREAVFERFTRADAPRDRASGGTGLGLAIARQIAASHGGSITIEDGPGTIFAVRLPGPSGR